MQTGPCRLLGVGLSALARALLSRRESRSAAGSSYYAEHFDTVEVNSTFYRLASPAAVESWLEQSPEGFIFAVKMSRYMTHIKRLTMLEQGTKRFYERLEGLTGTDKFGPVLWQFPPNFHRDDERLGRRPAEAAARPPRLRVPARELVHRRGLRTAQGARRGAGDRRRVVALGAAPHTSAPPTGPTSGFHHGSRGRHGNYSASEIETWAPPDRAVAPRDRGLSPTSTTTGRATRSGTPSCSRRQLGV